MKLNIDFSLESIEKASEKSQIVIREKSKEKIKIKMTSSANDVKIEISNKKTGQVTRYIVKTGMIEEFVRVECSGHLFEAEPWVCPKEVEITLNDEERDEQHITREFDNDVNDIENLDRYLMSSDSEFLLCSELFKNVDQLMDMGVNENKKIKTTSQAQIYIEHSSLI